MEFKEINGQFCKISYNETTNIPNVEVIFDKDTWSYMKSYVRNGFIESINTSLDINNVSKYYGQGLSYISLANDIKLDATERGWAYSLTGNIGGTVAVNAGVTGVLEALGVKAILTGTAVGSVAYLLGSVALAVAVGDMIKNGIYDIQSLKKYSELSLVYNDGTVQVKEGASYISVNGASNGGDTLKKFLDSLERITEFGNPYITYVHDGYVKVKLNGTKEIQVSKNENGQISLRGDMSLISQLYYGDLSSIQGKIVRMDLVYDGIYTDSNSIIIAAVEGSKVTINDVSGNTDYARDVKRFKDKFDSIYQVGEIEVYNGLKTYKVIKHNFNPELDRRGFSVAELIAANPDFVGRISDDGTFALLGCENIFTGSWETIDDIEFPLIGNERNNIIYGTGNSDRLIGGAGDDTIYGSGQQLKKYGSADGNDYIEGGEGNDKLYGGIGWDKYIYGTYDFGNDIIDDSDRRGTIEFDYGFTKYNLRGSWKEEKGIYYYKDNISITARKSGSSLIIERGSNSITVKNFTEGDYGIRFTNRFLNMLNFDMFWNDFKIRILEVTIWNPILANFGNALTAAMPIRRCDPLILDLDGDGVETSAMAEGTYFDLNGDGSKEKAGWVGQDDGLLVYDRNSDGVIDSGRELFGDQTRLRDGRIAQTGFEALSEFDSNSDGLIDKNDREFKKLKVWQDSNSDGISQTEEIKTLEDLGIESINLASETVNKEVNGNIETN